MRSARRRAALLLGTALLALAWSRVARPDAGEAGTTLALVGATAFPAPGAPRIPDAVVLVRDGRIEAVGSREQIAVPGDAQRIDCAGLSVAAGFWNSHVHLSSWHVALASFLPQALGSDEWEDLSTRRGFVHILDTGSWLVSTTRLRRRIEEGSLPGPEIRTTGSGFAAVGGSPFYIRPLWLPELASAEQARDAVRAQLDAGADAIKLFTGGLAEPGRVVLMDVAIVHAVAEAAHARRALVVAHPTTSDGARIALEGGVDILAHTFPGDPSWDRSLLPRMKQAGMALIPTLSLWPYDLGRFGRDQETIDLWVRTAQEQVAAFVALGGRLLFGTDVGYVRDFDPAREYALLSGAGLSFAQILASLTTAPAERFAAATHTGRIAAGLDADLTLFEGDPEQEIAALARVRMAIRRGRIVYRDASAS